MKAVVEALYTALATDTQLQALLSDDGSGNPAIYLVYGPESGSPYVVITPLDSVEQGYAMTQQSFQVDAVERTAPDRASYLALYEIRDRIVKILDRQDFLAGEYTARFFRDSERPIEEDSGRLRRYSVDFVARYFRFNDI